MPANSNADYGTLIWAHCCRIVQSPFLLMWWGWNQCW